MKLRHYTQFAKASTLALCVGGAAIVPGCSNDENPEAPTKEADTVRVGTLNLPLETVSSQGNIYRLREGRFRITSLETGERVTTLRTERDPFSSLISEEIPSGEHEVRLLDGWFLEKVILDGGTGGFGGAFGGDGDGDFPGGDGDFPVGVGGSFAGDGDGDGDFPVGVGGFFAGDGDGDGDFPGGVGGGAIAGSGGAVPGPFPGDFGEITQIVPAELVSDERQFIELGPGDDAFVFFTFRVGDDIIQFGDGRVHVGINVIEDEPGPNCPDEEQIQRRALFDTVEQVTQAFSMQEVFQALANNAGLATPGERIFQEIIDSYASQGAARLPDAIHCGDEITNGQPSLNGFPIECDRLETLQFDNLDSFFPTAVVNRLDLAPQSGAHCGQQRLLFASNSFNRMFFIFEAQIPNPQPELGLSGCQPIAEFWAEQAAIDDPVLRGSRLREAFLFGLPELLVQGVGPFMTATNLTAGSGQIRTNQFDSAPWTLREFKLAQAGSELSALPFPVAEAPNGQLWNDNVNTPQGEACRDAFLESLPFLLTDNVAAMSFPVPQECKDAESRNDFSQNYAGHLQAGDPNGFRAELAAALEGTGLTPVDIANRAHFAGSCIGCHEEAIGRNLGNGVISPFSNSFVHVDEFGGGDCADGPCFRISPAVRDVFLPHRLQVLEQFVDLPESQGCGGGGMGGAGGEPGEPIEPDFPPSGTGGSVSFPIGDEPVEPLELELPSASTPTAEMVETDLEIRETFGEQTIGGQSAQRSH